MKKLFPLLAAIVLMTGFGTLPAQAEDLSLAEGKLTMTPPEAWEKKEPRTRIVESEFAVPPTEGESEAGRLTIMAAGGSLEQNIARWENQFRGDGPVKAEIEEVEIGALKVHIVEINGTFLDSPRGPLGPTVPREGYRMLGAIIEGEGIPVYYVKLTGPAATLEQNEGMFKNFVRSVKLP